MRNELGTLLTLGVLQCVGPVIGQTGLQNIQIISNAGHRPTGHFQGKVLALADLDKLIEGFAVSRERSLHLAHHGLVGGRLALKLLSQGLQCVDARTHIIRHFRVAVQGVVLLLQAHLEQPAIEGRHLLEAIETQADALQRPNANGSDQGGQQQYEDKTHPQFFRHPEVGKTCLHGRNHSAQSPFEYQKAFRPFIKPSWNHADSQRTRLSTSLWRLNNGKKLRASRFQDA